MVRDALGPHPARPVTSALAYPEGNMENVKMWNEATLRELKRSAACEQRRAQTRALAQVHRLPPGVGALEASAAAYAVGAMHRRGGEDRGAALFAAAALQAFAAFADGSRAAPHAEAAATGILAACAYRSGLGGQVVPAPGPPMGESPSRRLEIVVGARVVATEGP
jgi:hypothetical protein